MKRSSVPLSPIGMISALLLYLLFMVAFLLLSNQLLINLSSPGSTALPRWAALFLLPPLVLLFILGYNFFLLFRHRRNQSSGARLKIKLILFFALISLLSSLPQGILSFNFINFAVTNWFSQDLNEALDGGVQIALEYYHDKNQELKDLAESIYLPGILRASEDNPEALWPQLKDLEPGIGSIQIFSHQGEELLFYGQKQGRIEKNTSLLRGSGLLAKETSDNLSVLRYQLPGSFQGEPVWIVLSLILPADFDEKARNLTYTSNRFKQLNAFSELFQGALVFLFLLFSLPLLLLAVLLGFFFSQEILRPLLQLEKATQRVAEGDFSPRILVRPSDELSSLVLSFNSMIAELEASRSRSRREEKITTWQEIAQQLAHEIRNPLTPIKLSAERVLHKHKKDPGSLETILEPAMEAIIHEVNGLSRMLSQFREFARLPETRRKPINLEETIGEALMPFIQAYPDIQWEQLPEGAGPALLADPDQLHQVFSNLFQNAAEAIAGVGLVQIRAFPITKGEAPFCRISIRDTGEGIPEEDQPSIFQPYFTTKKTGTGLGLSIVERIVHNHQGTIWFDSAPTQDTTKRGTTFYIDLPREET